MARRSRNRTKNSKLSEAGFTVVQFDDGITELDQSQILDEELIRAKRVAASCEDEELDVQRQLRKAEDKVDEFQKIQRVTREMRAERVGRVFGLLVIAYTDNSAARILEQKCDALDIPDRKTSHIAIRLCQLALGCDEQKASYYAMAIRGALLRELTPRQLKSQLTEPGGLTLGELVYRFKDAHPSSRRAAWITNNIADQKREKAKDRARRVDEEISSSYIRRGPDDEDLTDIDPTSVKTGWSEKARRHLAKRVDAGKRCVAILVKIDDADVEVIDLVKSPEEAAEIFETVI